MDKKGVGSPGRTRTSDMVINSHPLYQLSYRGSTGAYTGAPIGINFARPFAQLVERAGDATTPAKRPGKRANRALS
jgi:hypothetical protein